MGQGDFDKRYTIRENFKRNIQSGVGNKGFFKNLIDRYYAKKEEKEFIEAFTCESETKTCTKISQWTMFKLYLKDFHKRRILSIDGDYTWTDWEKTQTGVDTYKERIKKLDDDKTI